MKITVITWIDEHRDPENAVGRTLSFAAGCEAEASRGL